MSLRKTLLSGALSIFLLGGGLASAEEIKQPLAIERTLEEKTSKPKVEINVNYKSENEQKGVDYQTSWTLFFPESENLYRDSNNVPELTNAEETQVENILRDIKNNNINSYQSDLIPASQNLSESQNLVLASAIGGWLGMSTYDINLLQNEAFSQEEFLYRLQNSLSIGTCGHIHTHSERYLNDLEIKSAVVTGLSKNGIGHAFTISKIENGTAIIDYGNILITNTKNIEKTLEAYQKNKGITAFQHLFFEDTKFKYQLITKDGRNFLNFIGYDESSEQLKNSLIQDFKPEPYLKANINLEDYLTSAEFNLFGLFFKAGDIRGDANSSLEKLTLSQIGFKRGFLTPHINNKFLNFVFGNKIININGNFVKGNIFQEAGHTNLKNHRINYDIIFATNNEKGFNLSSRIAENIYSTKDSTLFYDSILGAGISCKIPIKNTSIEPYIISQFNLFKKNIDKQEIGRYLSELGAGAILDIKPSNNINLLVEPYYSKKIWEQEFGINTEIKGKYFGLKVGGHATKSDYDFCPGKFGFDVGLTMDMKELLINLNYSINEINYDDEKENQSSFNVQANLKL